MKLVSIEIENFLVFSGLHRLEFSVADDEPITVIIGENGSGKTTILNAIYWAFTGNFTKQFDNSKSLINKDAASKGVSECYVELIFIDNNEKYRVRRTFQRSGASRLNYYVISDGIGNAIKPELAESFIQKLLPKELAAWFIFDGEDIRAMRLSGSVTLKENLHRTFGFLTMSNLIKDLEAISLEYAKEEGRLLNNTEITDCNNRIESNENNKEIYQKKISDLNREIEIEENAEAKYRNELSGLNKSSGITARRDRATRTRNELNERLKRREFERSGLISDSAPSIFVHNQIVLLDDSFEVKEHDQSLPAPYGDRLIFDIQKSRQCICGRLVTAGSLEERNILKLLDSAGTSALSERITRLRSAVTAIRTAAVNYIERSKTLVAEINGLQSEIADQDEIIKQATAELMGIDEQQIQELEKKRADADRKAKKCNEERGYFQKALEDANVAITRDKAKRDLLLSKLERNVTLRAERLKVEKLQEYVLAEFTRQEKEVLATLGAELSSVLRRYLTKHFTAKVDPSTYAVTVFDIDGRETSLSTGESHILKFAFIAAIVGMAGSKTQTSKVQWVSHPVISPLVLDAPFSVNDKGYRASIANNLSEQASQLIMMFDSDKWDSEMAGTLQSKVGKFYVVISRAKGAVKDVVKTLKLKNKKIALNEYDAERDESRWEEVTL